MLRKLKWTLILLLLAAVVWVVLAVDWAALLPSSQVVVRSLAALLGLYVAYRVGKLVWLRGLKSYHQQMRQLGDLKGKSSLSHGSADFATRADLKKAGFLGDKGVILGKFDGKFLRFNQPGHLITFAPTRSGKGVGHVIPNLLTHPGSVVVNDIKGENFAVSGRFRSTFSKVYTFAPFGEKSDCFNPIDFIRVGTDNELDDVKLIADMMILEDNANDPFWSREARSLVEGLILYVATESPPPLRNIAEVRYLIMQTRRDFELMIEDMLRVKHPFIKRVAASITATEPKVLASVLSTAKSQTAIWDSPKLAKITSRSDFKLEDLKKETISLYLIIPPENLAVYAPVVRLIIGMAVKAMTRDGGKQPKERVLFLVDEFPALQYMQPIEEAVGFLAGYGIHIWLFIQDLSQIKDLYERWATFISNCAVRMAFGTNDVETAKTLSDMLGTTTITVKGEGSTEASVIDKMKVWKKVIGGGKNINLSETSRALMTPDEVMRLPNDSQLIFIQGAKPVVAEKLRYFADPYFKGKFDKWG
ncbi:MAG: type IV secretory system conjugative DNA transfer family protein [Pseudomonadaceae bacterium]|nr:type IV secretory system conjugative DNA transfer family protein [Pseudomonadaceae bacterium]